MWLYVRLCYVILFYVMLSFLVYVILFYVCYIMLCYVIHKYTGMMLDLGFSCFFLDFPSNIYKRAQQLCQHRQEDRRSVSGGIHMVGETIINWMSKTQAWVTLSSTETEYCGLALGAMQVKFVQQLLEEIAECKTPGRILKDNTGAIFLVKNQQVGRRTKHIQTYDTITSERWGNKEKSMYS